MMSFASPVSLGSSNDHPSSSPSSSAAYNSGGSSPSTPREYHQLNTQTSSKRTIPTKIPVARNRTRSPSSTGNKFSTISTSNGSSPNHFAVAPGLISQTIHRPSGTTHRRSLTSSESAGVSLGRTHAPNHVNNGNLNSRLLKHPFQRTASESTADYHFSTSPNQALTFQDPRDIRSVSRNSVNTEQLTLSLTRSVSSGNTRKNLERTDLAFNGPAENHSIRSYRGLLSVDDVRLLEPEREIKDEIPPFVVRAPSSSTAGSEKSLVDILHSVPKSREELIKGTTPSTSTGSVMNKTAFPSDSASGPSDWSPAHNTRKLVPGRSSKPSRNGASSNPSSVRAQSIRGGGNASGFGSSSAFSTPTGPSRDRNPSAEESRSRELPTPHSALNRTPRSESSTEFGRLINRNIERFTLPHSKNYEPHLPHEADLVPPIELYTPPKGTKWDDAPIPTVAKRMEKDRLEREERERKEEEEREKAVTAKRARIKELALAKWDKENLDPDLNGDEHHRKRQQVNMKSQPSSSSLANRDSEGERKTSLTTNYEATNNTAPGLPAPSMFAPPPGSTGMPRTTSSSSLRYRASNLAINRKPSFLERRFSKEQVRANLDPMEHTGMDTIQTGARVAAPSNEAIEEGSTTKGSPRKREDDGHGGGCKCIIM